jgi:hypothetical protein
MKPLYLILAGILGALILAAWLLWVFGKGGSWIG